jgi:hypothetical protein
MSVGEDIEVVIRHRQKIEGGLISVEASDSPVPPPGERSSEDAQLLDRQAVEAMTSPPFIGK